METTNEELQFSNEELLSANEELQSTNEELQSVNEELYTVNAEYHEKIHELTKVNADVDNLMKSTDLGILFLDDAMLVRKFTDAVTSEFNLLPSDLNRPFHHISHKFRYQGLLDDIAKCIETRETLEKELSTHDNRRVILKILPYLDSGQSPAGVVLVMNDITRVRSLETKIAESHQHFKRVMGGIEAGEPTHAISVLLVDDRDADRQWLRSLLNNVSDTKFQIFEAKSSEEALSVLSGSTMDVCLIDYRLGSNENALDFIEDLASRSSVDTLPVFILVSGMLTGEIYDRSRALPIYEAIDKENVSGLLLDKCISHALQKKELDRFFRTAPA